MDDLEIDRALRAALSEEPSPEFVARLRSTLAQAPRPSIVAGWLKPAAAIGCAAVVAIAMGLPREEAQQRQDAQLKLSPTEATPAAAGLEPSPTIVQSGTAAVVVPAFRPARAALPAAAAHAADADEPIPEVIIAAEDVEAVRQFVSSARDRRFVATFEEAPTPTQWAMNDLAIAPITVEPLDATQSHNN